MKKTHGSEYQSGLPDLYIAHLRYGTRWVETKILGHYRFTPAQIKTFREMAAAGVGIWILVDDTEYEMKKLFLPPNWHLYLKW